MTKVEVVHTRLLQMVEIHNLQILVLALEEVEVELEGEVVVVVVEVDGYCDA